MSTLPLGGIKLSDGKGIKQVMQTVTHSSQRGYNLSTPVFSSNTLADSLKLVLAKQIHAKKKIYIALFILKNVIYTTLFLCSSRKQPFSSPSKQ